MTPIISQYTVVLDRTWVDHILETAFDGNYGGSWYWINEDDDVKSVSFWTHGQDDKRLARAELTLNVDPHDHGEWREDVLERSRGVIASLDWRNLSYACEKILNDLHLSRTETGRQLRLAIETPEEAPDLDAEACDVLVQIALFDQVVYG